MSNFCQQGDITKIFIVDTGNTGSTGTDIYVTGGTYSSGTLTLGRNDGVSLLISGFLTGTTDTFITGGTYSEGVLILNRNDGVNISISGFSTTAIFTGNTSASCVSNLYISNLHGCSPITVWDPINSLSYISATTYYGDGSNLTGIPDYYVTGGTYSNGTLTLNRQNGSVSVSGFLTGTTDTFTTGFTYSNNNLTINRNQGLTPLTVSINNFTGLTINGSLSASTYLGLPIDPDNFVTGGTFSSGTLTLNRQNGSVTITGITDNFVTGGTYSNGTLTLNRQNGLVTITGFLTGTTDTDNFVTGGTYSNGVLTLNRQNGSVSISGLLSADTFVTGFTFNTGTYDLTIFQNNGVAPLTQNLGILAGDITVTGGTYNPSNGVATFFNNVGGSFQVSGFLTGFTDIYLSSGNYNPNTGNLTLTRTDNVNVVVTGFTDYYVTGGTYSNGTLTLNRQNGSVTIPGFLTGGTVTGIDTYVTGFTYNDANKLTISQNQGQAPLNVFINTFTGLTVNGSISATTLSAVALSPVNYIDFNINPTIPSITGGTLYFDYNENALSYKPITSGNDVTVNIGQESLIRIYNQTGVQINNGQVLHITGATGGIPTVALANASKLGLTFTDSLAQSSGVATHNIPNGGFGFMTNFGIVRDLNTSGFTVGQELFLSDTIDGGITNNPNSIALTSRISTIGWCLSSDPVNGKIYVKIENENPLQSLTQQEVNVLLGNVISTGTYYYTGATTASTTTINVSQMRGWIVYNTYEYSTNPLVLNIYYSGGTNISLPNLTSADATYLLVNSGGTLYQQTSFPTPQQRRENIFLGKVVHPNRTTILNVNNTVDYDVSPMSSLRDLWSPIKLINEGVLVSPNGSNLNINISSGTLWGNGIGWVTNELNPNSVGISAKVPASFFYRTQTGGTSSSVSVIDPTKYDVNGAITSMGAANSDNASNQRVYLYPTGVLNILYGQTNYGSLTEAVAGIQTESFVVYPNAKNTGILIGIISVRNDIVADGQPLTNSSYAVFTPVSKFGELLGGTGGLSTTTLQQAYNNSTNPEIVTNSTLDGVQFRGGTGSDTDKNIIIENNAGTQTAWLNADGSSLFTTLTATTKIITTNFQMTSGATNGYVLTSDASGNARWAVSTGGSGSTGTDYYVTGGTYNNTTGILTLNRQNGSLSIPGFTTSLSGYALNYYGSFSNTGNIPVTAANTSTVWTYNQTELSNGITIVDNSKIKVFNKGVYEIGYSPQIEKTQGTDALVTIWAEVNGNPVTRSSSTLGLVSNSTYQLPFVSLIFELEANDYVQFYFSSNSQYVQLTALSGLTTPTRPDSPSLIVIAKQIGASVPSSYVFTGNTSANCISDIYVSNLHGCSPITIHDSIQNFGSSATGITSFAFGNTTVAAGDYSHAEGNLSIASGIASHAEGNLAQAKGEYSHAEGDNTRAIGDYSHAEGQEAISSGSYSHAEGYATLVSGSWSHAEGRGSKTAGNYSHAEGDGSHAVGERSHAEGLTTSSLGYGSHSEGLSTATGIYAYTLDSVLAGVLTLNTSYGDVTTEFKLS
jgi:hypothetical protein